MLPIRDKDWSTRGFRTFGPQFSVIVNLIWDKTPQICMGPSSVAGTDVTAAPDDVDWVLPDQEVAGVLVKLFRQVPQVKSICAQFNSEEMTIWTLLESYDRTAREEVYKKELEICQKLNIKDFDFRVTSVDLVSPAELIEAGSTEIYRRV